MSSVQIPVTTTGSNGSATGNATAEKLIEGMLTSIRVQSSGVPTTSDITIAEEQPDGNYINVVVLTNVASQVRLDIQVPTYGAAGAATGQYAYPHITGKLKATIAQANAATINVILGIIPI